MINKDVRGLPSGDVIFSHTMEIRLKLCSFSVLYQKKTRLVKIQIKSFYVPFVSY